MIRFQGIHIAKVDPGCAAAEGTVMHHKGGTISNGLVVDAHTLIGHEWHSLPPIPPSTAFSVHKIRAVNERQCPFRGQKAKYSLRADVFRSCAVNGHHFTVLRRTHEAFPQSGVQYFSTHSSSVIGGLM